MTDPVPPFHLGEAQPTAKHGIVGCFGLGSGRIRPQLVRHPGLLKKLARAIPMLFIDNDASRQHAEGALENAHMLIQHQMRDVSALEQRLDRSDEHRVVGTDKLVQLFAPDTSAPPPLFGRRTLREISEKLQFAATSRHRIEDQTRTQSK